MRPACFSAPMIRALSRIALPASLLVLAAALSAQTLRNHFESDALGREPAFFDFVVLGAPGAARWNVTGGHNPPSAPNYVAQIVDSRPRDSIAAALRRNSSFRDGTWSVALLGAGGRGGILFRMADEKNFLVLLIDHGTREAVLTAYRDGRPTELAKGSTQPANEWGVLKITADGPKVSASWDGKPLLEAADSKPTGGRSGMATAGPGIGSFDEFILEPSENR